MKKHVKDNSKKKERELITIISVFLLGREELRNQFWNIKSAGYNHHNQTVNVGITTINGKLGTTLQKLRKTCRPLSDYLYEQGITFRKAHINFFVDRKDEKIHRVQKLIEKIEVKSN